jgi:predicted RNA-binding protein with PIN domain
VRAIARIIDHDSDYRSTVAAEVDEQRVGRAGWLWLTRPDGWEDELDRLRADADADAAAASDEREERDARRRLAAARAAAERATAAATAREQEAAEIRADLVEERTLRRALEARITALETDLDAARDERARAIRQLKQKEAVLARRTEEAKQTVARLKELHEQPRSTDSAVTEPDPASSLDPAALVDGIQAAARRANELIDALRDLEAKAQEANRGTDGAPLSATADASDPDSCDDGPGDWPQTPTRRLARALPGGIRDDSVEAVEHLLRIQGVVLAVDGYNVSMTGWPDMPVAEQRRRLVLALGDAAARTGTQVEVIFDGAEVEPIGLPRSARPLVCVRFSPADVEADDVLLDLVSQLPASRPVVVASSDNRVRDGARFLGANLVHARQLVELIRR